MNNNENSFKYGDFKTLYQALFEASKKKEYSNFILNDPIENFVYLKFLFDTVDEIDVFVENVDYLVDTYNKAKSLVEDDKERKSVLGDFWQSFEKYMSKKYRLKVIYKNDHIKDRFKEQDLINKILFNSNFETGLCIFELPYDLSIVDDLNFFLLVPKYKMVLTVQKMGNETFHLCYFHNEDLYKNVKYIYDTFMNLGNPKSQKVTE